MTNPAHLLAIAEFVRQAGNVAQAVLADGKVDLRDVVQLARLWSPAKAALEALKGVPADVQNLDSEAVGMLAQALVNCVDAWAKVFASGALAAV